jgi:hypothetical protein
MRGWFDEEPGTAGEAVPLPALSPKCAASEHDGCEGWWWTIFKSVARTCECWCHQPARAASAAAAAGRPLGTVAAPRLRRCVGWSEFARRASA